MTGRRSLVALVLVMSALCLMPALADAQGCAMCRTSVGGADDPLAKGIFKSVLFLVSMPALLLFTVGGWLVYKFNHVPPGATVGSGDGAGTDVPPTAARVVDFRRRET